MTIRLVAYATLNEGYGPPGVDITQQTLELGNVVDEFGPLDYRVIDNHYLGDTDTLDDKLIDMGYDRIGQWEHIPSGLAAEVQVW